MVKGVKIHGLVNALGQLLKVVIMTANEADVWGAAALSSDVPKGSKVHVDLGYRGKNTKLHHRVFHGKKRWVIERTWAWMMRQRRLFNCYERSYASFTSFIYLFSVQQQIRQTLHSNF